MTRASKRDGVGVRAAIRSEIAAISPFDERERAHREEALAWIDEGADLYRRKEPATPATHLVATFVCMDGDHVLLVDHRDAGLWLPTGGYVQPDEHPRDTVRRALREELAVTAPFAYEGPLLLSIDDTVGRSVGHRDVQLWYVLSLRRTSRIRFDVREFRDVHWFAVNELPQRRTEPNLRRLLAKLASVRFSSRERPSRIASTRTAPTARTRALGF